MRAQRVLRRGIACEARTFAFLHSPPRFMVRVQFPPHRNRRLAMTASSDLPSMQSLLILTPVRHRRIADAMGRRQPALVLEPADRVLAGDACLECGSRPTRPHQMEAMARPLHAPHVAAYAHCRRRELEQPRFCLRRAMAGVLGAGLRFRLPAQQALRQGEGGCSRRGLRPSWSGSIATDAGP